MTTIALESVNLPGRFVRHANFLGELTPVASDLDRQDATFSLLGGLSDDRLVSFGSANFPTRALRHQSFRIRLDDHTGAGDTPLQRADSTFVLMPGLADPTAVSFRSVNFPDRFLRHRDFHLFVEPVSGPGELDATFRIVPGFLPHFTFDGAISTADRTRLVERHRVAVASIAPCTRLDGREKLALLVAYDKAIRHGINTDPNANASAPVGGSRVDVNFGVLFPQGDVEISQTLIHEMMHSAGETHPDRRDPTGSQSCTDPAPRPFDCPGDNGVYFGTPPLRAEFCIAGSQDDAAPGVDARAGADRCEIDAAGVATLRTV